MKTLKKIWYDLDDILFGIITSVLDKYCVPYKTRRIRQRDDIFDVFQENYDYEVEVELAIDKKIGNKSVYDFILDKVEERLKLEDCYDMTEDETDFEMRKSIIEKCGDPFNILKDTNGKSILDKVSEITEHQKILNKIFQPKKKTFLDKIREMMKPLIGKKKDTDKIQKMFDEAVKNGTLRKRTNKSEKIEGQYIKYEDLPKADKNVLKSKFPESILKSDKCKIKRIQIGPMVSLSVEIEQEM